jgi:N-carbamoylputrescine amidase
MAQRSSRSARKPTAAATNRTVRVGITQMACGPNPQANLAKQLRMLTRAVEQGAKIVCTQELFRSQYFCQSEDHACFGLAESIPGPSTDALCAFAKQHEVVVVGSLFEKRASGLYHNTAVIIDADGALMGIYRKMHIPDDPLFYEKFYFTPGDTGFKAWKTRYATIGVLVCWDQWYPEAARLTALQGAEILFYPTAIGWHPSEKKEYGKAQHESWELIQRSHGVANGCFVCSPNRIGHELVLGPNGKPVNTDGIQFWGQSFISAPNGQIVERASIAKPEAIVADLNLDLVEAARTHWPFLRDRRIDAYGALTQRFSD